jgi:hypothetical protein
MSPLLHRRPRHRRAFHDRAVPLTRQIAFNSVLADAAGLPAGGIASGAGFTSALIDAGVGPPALGRRLTLLSLNVPTALVVAVAAAAAVTATGHVVNVALLRNRQVTFAVDVPFTIRKTGTFGFDFWGGNATIAGNFPNPIDYLNGDLLEWQYTYQNAAGVTIQPFAQTPFDFFAAASAAGVLPRAGSFMVRDLPLDAPPESGGGGVAVMPGADIIEAHRGPPGRGT